LIPEELPDIGDNVVSFEEFVFAVEKLVRNLE
jgi:hypothetical protein